MCLGLCVACPPVVYADSSQAFFAQGIEAFRSHRLQEAREFFLQAEQAGQSDAKLMYNLGVVHYRLQDFSVAEGYFLSSLRFAETRQIALYNLGRCAEALNHIRRADGYYRQAQAGKDPRIGELARKAEASLEWPFWASWGLSAELALGFDSSVVGLTDQVTAQPLRTADLFERARIDARYNKIPVPDGELAFRLLGQQLAYESERQVDLQSLTASLDWQDVLANKARWGWRLHSGQEWLDNQAYQARFGLRARYEQGWQSFWLTLDAEAEWFESQQARLRSIDGGRYQVTISLLERVWSGVGMLKFAGQLNLRRSEQNSPQRVSVTALWRSPQWRGLTWQPSLQWRDSHYSDEAYAKERRLRTQIRISSPINQRWQTVVDLEYEDNASEQRARDYHHAKVLIGLRWQR